MKRIYFDPYCFKGGTESQESINIWTAYKEEFKDLKEFFKFCMNSDWDYIFCAADTEDYYYGFSWETLA